MCCIVRESYLASQLFGVTVYHRFQFEDLADPEQFKCAVSPFRYSVVLPLEVGFALLFR